MPDVMGSHPDQPDRERQADILAFDRASVRSVDADGRLHVELTPISKANVCPYLGNEIPGWEDLGLKPDQVYQLLRDPEELAKAASTFNNLPILSKHVPVTADDHHPDLVVGSTGTDAVFEAPYLKNSLVIWASGSIKRVENNSQKELSSGYRYRPDMTPGSYQGERYDGVMRDIIGNHIALVAEGRAGSDVVVGDSNEGLSQMKLSRKAALLQGAALAYLAPKLAQDAKIDLTKAIAGVTAKNFKDRKPGIVTAVKAAAEGKLAQDATLDDLNLLLDKLDEVNPAEDAEVEVKEDPSAMKPDMTKPDKADVTKDASPADKLRAFLTGKIKPEDVEQACGMLGMAEDEDEDMDPEGAEDEDGGDDNKDMKDMVTKPAMDAAIARTAADTETRVMQRVTEAAEAREFVRPFVGNLPIALDSAEAVLRQAAIAMDIKDAKTIHPSALRSVISATAEARNKRPTAPIAQDSASVKGITERNPHASRVMIL